MLQILNSVIAYQLHLCSPHRLILCVTNSQLNGLKKNAAISKYKQNSDRISKQCREMPIIRINLFTKHALPDLSWSNFWNTLVYFFSSSADRLIGTSASFTRFKNPIWSKNLSASWRSSCNNERENKTIQ